MRLQELSRALQSAPGIASGNDLLLVVHACMGEFAEVERERGIEVEMLKEMVHRLEDRLREALEVVKEGFEGHVAAHGVMAGGVN